MEIACTRGALYFTACKLLWVRKHEPELYARAAKMLLPKDYIRYRLTGEFATDVSDASGTILLNVARRKWSPELCQALDIPLDFLPAVHESCEPTGQVSASVSRELGLDPGCWWSAAAATRPAPPWETGSPTRGSSGIRWGLRG